jgi:hypothetical protein
MSANNGTAAHNSIIIIIIVVVVLEGTLNENATETVAHNGASSGHCTGSGFTKRYD